MSFMFNPYPYDDPNAFNALDGRGIALERIAAGSEASAAALAAAPGRIVAIDGYSTAPLEELAALMEQQYARQGVPVRRMEIEDLWQEEAPLTARLTAENLPEDREKDPVLLYGKIFEGTYEDLFDGEKLAAAAAEIRSFRSSGTGVLLVVGYGALCSRLCPLYDRRIYLDTTPMRAMLRLHKGEYRNVGTKTAFPFKKLARRCYYVDYIVSAQLRFQLLHEGKIDNYCIADDPGQITMLPAAVLEQVFRRAMEYPLRCKPVYLEGVWGGYYVQRLRHLPAEMRNCAWVFDMIPMEVSIVFAFGERRLEFPFYTLVQSQGPELMGHKSVEQFGYYFPVRFNYDDTFHASGNMSLQCHPDGDFVCKTNGELGRQDESYYIVDTAQGARTYLGFRHDADVEQFLAEAHRSETEHTPVEYDRYVYSVKSEPGLQVMIPAGTVHASGRNQLILEIGSLTVGSYTYKMYDYLRRDLDGNPRPIHLYYGSKVLARDRREDWVEANLVNGGRRTIREGKDWSEYIVGEHSLLYFSLRNLRFVDRIEDDTNGGFHVLTLVDGEQVLIRSKEHPERCFVQNYLDIVVVPAAFGAYEILNQRAGTTVVEHKTMLKPEA